MKRFTEDEFDDDFYGDDDELRDLEIPVLTPGRLRERAKKRNEQKQNSKGPDSGRYYKNNRDDYEDYPEDTYYGEEDYPDEDSDAEDPYRESGYYEEEGYAGDAPGPQYDDPGADREQTGQESADRNPRGQKRSNRSVEDRAARVRQARGNTERRRKKKRRRRSPVTPALVAVVLILFTVGCATAMKIVEKFSYSNERESLTSLFPDDPDRALVIMNGEITEDTVLLKDSELYFTLEQAHELSGNTRLYMDSTGSLLYTTPTEIITSAPGDTSDSSGASGSDGKAISFVDEGGAVYISAAYLKNYCRFSYTLYEDPYRVSIITEDTTVSKSRVHKDSHIRTYADRKSPILADVARSETVRFLEEEEKWSKVMTDSGVTGYIETKELSAPTDEIITPDSDYTEPEYSSIHMSGTVNMSWLLVYQQSGESLLTEYTANTKALNVISPTWMSVSGGTGDIVSYGTKAFVDKAHDMGLQVWPMLDDFTSGTGDAPMVLSSLNYRTALVNNIMAHLNETGS
nr:hypothetical protein [Lachnospiraceae bacterium]